MLPSSPMKMTGDAALFNGPALRSWEITAKSKRSANQDKIPAEWRLPHSTTKNYRHVVDVPRTCHILTAKEVAITEENDACGLLSKLTSGQLTSLEVTTAFCKRAAIAQQLTNCLTETFFTRALKRAAELDAYFAQHGRPYGPLHGIPISVKDTFNVAGVATTVGLVSFLDRGPPTEDAALVRILHNAGAVLYVKSNVPQTLMAAESHNNVFGRTCNPHGLHLGPGGSSGGEGALVGLRGAPIGIGTDIAGSIRIPALCCGVVGFKPSANRVPYGGQESCHRPGLPGFPPCAGPLVHSVRDAALLLKAVWNSDVSQFDETALPLPWREVSSLECSGKLKIGLLPEDPALPLHPPMRRVLAEAAAKLQAAGHEIVDLSQDVPCTTEMSRIAFGYFHMDPKETVFSHLAQSGEPKVPSVTTVYQSTKTESIGAEPDLDMLLDLNAATSALKSRFNKAWVKHSLDILLGPGYQGGCAQPHDMYGNGYYTVPWNLLDYPACVLPFSKASKTDDAKYLCNVAYKPPYDPNAVEGAPCHVQLVGRYLRDEVLLKNAEAVEKVLKA